MCAPAWLERENSLIGEEAVDKLTRSSVLVLGVGGVGSYCAEALVRAGIGSITVVDNDTVSESNINRQLIALRSTVGVPKVEVFADRAHDINPGCEVAARQLFITPGNAPEIIGAASPDFICDCIDNVSAKIALAAAASERGIPIIMSMGTGNKLDASHFMITDISKTHTCPLARVMRRELSERGIKNIPVLWSDEAPVHTGNRVPSSISFVPSAAGLMIAGYVVRKLIGNE